MSADKIATLEAQVELLTARLDALQHEVPAASRTRLVDLEPVPGELDEAVDSSAAGVSRRQWVRGAAAAAVGGTAAVVAGARPVAAAAGEDLVLGQLNTSGSRTRADYTGAPVGGVGFLFQSGAASSSGVAEFPAALGGYTDRTVQPNGVFGFSAVSAGGAAGVVGVCHSALSSGVAGKSTEGAGLRGTGAYGLDASGTLAAAVLGPTSFLPPTASTEFHRGGELYVRAASDSGLAVELWFCTVGGTPGTWTQIAGPGLPGQFYAITPTRCYDSRVATPAPGTLSGGADRVVDISLGRDLTTGASTGEIVPEGAGAVAFNLAIVDTVGGGFLSVAPSFVSAAGAATINWSESGQVLNNGSITRIGNNRKVKVFAGGGSTNFVLDITGYWL